MTLSCSCPQQPGSACWEAINEGKTSVIREFLSGPGQKICRQACVALQLPQALTAGSASRSQLNDLSWIWGVGQLQRASLREVSVPSLAAGQAMDGSSLQGNNSRFESGDQSGSHGFVFKCALSCSCPRHGGRRWQSGV